MNFLKAFIDDCKYYDMEGIETRNIIKGINLENRVVLDIGAGIGRLSFPLAKHATKVIALDKDKRFKGYFNKNKKKNVFFINKKAEDYLKCKKKFDVVLLAWPTINFSFIKLVKNVMSKNSLFIFITCDNNSDFETIVDKLNIFNKNHFNKDIKNKIKFIKQLPKEFKLLSKKKLHTKYTFPNKKIAFKVIKNDLNLWFNIRLLKDNEEKLRIIIKEHEKLGKVIFGEKVWFYILKLRKD